MYRSTQADLCQIHQSHAGHYTGPLFGGQHIFSKKYAKPSPPRSRVCPCCHLLRLSHEHPPTHTARHQQKLLSPAHSRTLQQGQLSAVVNPTHTAFGLSIRDLKETAAPSFWFLYAQVASRGTLSRQTLHGQHKTRLAPPGIDAEIGESCLHCCTNYQSGAG